MQWVKVDNNTVDTFYRHLRCICIASVQEEIVNLGGANKAIELGVISLGMCLIFFTKIVLVNKKNFWNWRLKICKIFNNLFLQWKVTECFFELFLEVSQIRTIGIQIGKISHSMVQEPDAVLKIVFLGEKSTLTIFD